MFDSRAIAAEGETLELNPFAFWPDLKSRLVGLGGAQQGDDPDYAFHTLYAACGTGSIVYTVDFTNLRADRGTLILRVHELPEVMGASARQIAISQTQLTELIRNGGRVSLPARAREGSTFAVLGHIYGDTVATADALTVEVARRTPDPSDHATTTQFRADAQRVGTIAQIVGDHEGTLVAPVSQLCTKRQLEEPIFKAFGRQFAELEGRSAIERWEHAYLARVLDRYDAARAGARGLGVGGLGEPLGDWLSSMGCELVLTTPGEVAADSPLPSGATARTLDPRAVDGLSGFDFAYATRAGGVGGSDRQAVLRFVEDVLRAVKPGGLLTLTLPIDVAPREIGDDRGPLLRRSDINRIVLLLISRGHQVAQICPFGEAVAEANDMETLMVSAFGLVIRKAA